MLVSGTVSNKKKKIRLRSERKRQGTFAIQGHELFLDISRFGLENIAANDGSPDAAASNIDGGVFFTSLLGAVSFIKKMLWGG